MKKKINSRLISISVVAVIVTMLAITLVYYSLFQERVKEDLETEALLINAAGIENITENEELSGYKNIRITWISHDGEVLYDNDIVAESLQNHLDRPEVIEAFESGSGECVRESDTMNMRTFYYAKRLDDGTVLRVATEARSFLSVFFSAFPVIIILISLIIITCVVISHLLTNKLLEPIKAIADNLDHVTERTEYKELSPFIDRIREQHEDILSAAKIRQDFTANVSHELKTPITAISGYAELIENRMVDEKSEIKFASEIRRNAERLVNLVDDIINLSELEHSSVTDSFTQINVGEVIEERVNFLGSSAKSKNIEMKVHTEPVYINSDKNLIIELIDNLVGNAVRYNVPNGKVSVSVKNKGNLCEIEVEDTGIGIPKEDTERVFERFYRVDKSRSRETGGTGLGLAIVKHIVELHGGEIKLQSELGKGTKINVLI